MPNTPFTSNTPRRLVFSEQYQRIHGISPEDALAGYIPDFKESVIRPPTDRSVEGALSVKSNPIEHVLKDWKKDADNFFVGDRLEIASNLDVLTRHMRDDSRVNDVPLYHGGLTPPHELAIENNRPANAVPYSEDHHVARSFAKTEGYGGGKSGKIFKAAPGQVRGLNLVQFGIDNMTVGRSRRPEREWLIDPESFK